MALRQFVLPLAYGIAPLILIVIGAANSYNGNNGSVLIAIGYVLAGIFFCVDAFWIFKDEKRQRVTDIFAKTAVLNECVSA